MRVKLDLRPRDYIDTEKTPVHFGRIAALVIVLLFVGVSSATFIYGFFLSRSLRSERVQLESYIERMQEQGTRMNVELKRLQTQVKDYGKALLILQQELPSIEFLSVLEKALPGGVWLEKVDISAGIAALSGFAFTENDVVSFGRALSEASVIESVGFPVTSRIRQDGGASVRFSLDCRIRDIMSIGSRIDSPEVPMQKEASR
ncbi:MAG: PilN domain-containing protein [Thermovirgaceae bacterium]|nr:PilN domain-containing protein [Thermovirgaceae bacterium]